MSTLPQLIAVLVLTFALSAWPFAEAGSETVARSVMRNGLTVLVRESAAAPTVGVSLQLRAGSGTETRDIAGISTLVQRTMLRGTTRLSFGQLAEAADGIGGTLDASSDVDHVEVRGQALGRYWAELLSLVAEIALAPAFRPDEVERERRLLLAEIASHDDSPLGSAIDAALRALHGAHPYALPVLGHRETVAAITREALIARHRRTYRPGNAVLAVSGAVRAIDVVRVAERLFTRWPTGEPDLESAPPTTVAGTSSRHEIERVVHQGQIVIAYTGPSLGDPDYAAAKVLTTLLGGGHGSRLAAELRDRSGLAYTVSALNPTRRGPSPLIAYLGTAPANVDRAEARMLAEIDRIRNEPPDADALARAKAVLLSTWALDRRTNLRHAWWLAFFELVGVGWDFPTRFPRLVETVSADDVTAVARRRLIHPTVVVLRPAR